MQCVLFDDGGEVWDPKSPGLARTLGASIYGQALTDYTVKNLGFVAACLMGSSAHVRLRPQLVSQVALSGLLYWLHDHTLQRVMLSFLEADWTHELLPSRETAVGRLLERIKVGANDRAGDFLNRQRALDELPAHNPLRAILDAWSACNGRYDRERLAPVLQRAVTDRFFLVEASAASPNIFVRDIGTGFQKGTHFWLSRAIGHRVEDQPDFAYGKWLASVYGDIARTGAPSLDDVDAVITWPQQPRVGYRYRRLVVPFDQKSGSTLLLSATVIDPDVDLRVKSS